METNRAGRERERERERGEFSHSEKRSAERDVALSLCLETTREREYVHLRTPHTSEAAEQPASSFGSQTLTKAQNHEALQNCASADPSN
jgi:hypothetical protein